MASDITKMESEQLYNMGSEAHRLETFKNWPFGENSKCTPLKLAEAGFFHCPTKNEPDLVQCFVCFKELDGWEPDDDPWEEHSSHSKECLFVKFNKKEKDLTVPELFRLDCQRQINKMKKICAEKTEDIRNEAEKVRSELEKLVQNE